MDEGCINVKAGVIASGSVLGKVCEEKGSCALRRVDEPTTGFNTRPSAEFISRLVCLDALGWEDLIVGICD